MSKNYLLALVAGFALVMAGCGKTDPQIPDSGNDNNGTEQGGDENGTENGDENGNGNGDGNGNEVDKISAADFVGSWGQGESEDVFVMNEDGSYTSDRWGESSSGKWTFNEEESTITFTPSGSEAWTTKVLLIGGKAWLGFIEESDPSEEYPFRSTECFRKAGATVKSGTLGDGRWDAPHGGLKPDQYTEDPDFIDYILCLVVSGNNIDLYVPMWGEHIQGTFTLDDGRLHIETDDDHIWVGLTISRGEESWSYGWNAWNDEMDCLSMNPETFELRGYTWYTVNALRDMGHEPVDYTDYSFEAAIWNYADQLHWDAMDLCDFELCVTDDGKEAYSGVVGLFPWLYKR